MILRKKSGQSLIEILVAIGVGVIMLVGAVTALTPAIKSLSDVSRTQGAASASKELLDNLRIFADANWHNIDTLSTSTKYFLNTATSTFTVATGTEGIVADGITSGLVGHWKLDEASGSAVNDSSGYENNGTSSGAYATSGYVGGARGFNGSTDYVSLGNKSILNATSTITINAWINHNSPTGGDNSRGIILHKGNYGGGNGGYLLRIDDNNRFLCGIFQGTWYYPISSFTVSPNQWHMLTCTWDGSVIKMYLDGVQDPSTANASVIMTPNTDNLMLGKSSDATAALGVYKGLIDDSRVYNRALSATEVSTIYRANIFTRSFQVSEVYRDTNDSDKIIEGTSGSHDPSTKKITIEYGWPGSQLKSFSAYFTRYKNKSFVQSSWQSGPGTAYTTTTASWFTTSSNINYSTSTGIRILGL